MADVPEQITEEDLVAVTVGVVVTFIVIVFVLLQMPVFPLKV